MTRRRISDEATSASPKTSASTLPDDLCIDPSRLPLHRPFPRLSWRNTDENETTAERYRRQRRRPPGNEMAG
ncbi:hypothetical protein L6452_31205 [Arctium lappa]|uniref:Uncharacterized protein n=1 Tax=Arctium lappa TaxID=4217 RepID=A0ACB8ZKI9_ARCLA|nr:hypothetical protein L6452_31205 [Arctium lappa]